jgi:hypothetical protein
MEQTMRDRDTYIHRYENARSEMRESLNLAQGNPMIYEPWRMKEVLDTGQSLQHLRPAALTFITRSFYFLLTEINKHCIFTV